MLYGTNTLGFESSEALLHFKAQVEPCFRLIKHMDIFLGDIALSIKPSHSTNSSVWELETLLHVMEGCYPRSSINLRLRFTHIFSRHDDDKRPLICCLLTTFLKKIQGLQIKTDIILSANLKAVAELCNEGGYLTFTTGSSDSVADKKGEGSDDENYGVMHFKSGYTGGWGDTSTDWA